MFKENNIDYIADEVHRLAWEKGWHSSEETEDAFVERMCNNLHDEVSELHEAWRNNKLHAPCDKGIGLSCLEEEIADIIIRIFDNAKKLGIESVEKIVTTKHGYNKTRPERHGGKRS